MRVQVRNALADYIVDRDERSIGVKRDWNRGCDTLHECKKVFDEVSAQLDQRRNVFQRDDENVSFEERRAIEKRDRVLIAVHDVGSQSTRDNLAEHAGQRP